MRPTGHQLDIPDGLYSVERKGDMWMMGWKWCGRKRLWPFKVPSCHLPGGTEENHEKLQDNRPSGRDLYPEPPEYEAGVLTKLPRRSVSLVNDNYGHSDNDALEERCKRKCNLLCIVFVCSKCPLSMCISLFPFVFFYTASNVASLKSIFECSILQI
jgi:hypothetical protein